MNDIFGEVLYVHTRQNAIDDGILVERGQHKGKQVCFTSNLLANLELPEEVEEIKAKGFFLLKTKDPEEGEDYKFRKIDNDVFLVYTSWEGYTFMTGRDL